MLKKVICVFISLIILYSAFSINTFAENKQIYDGYTIENPPIEEIQEGSFPIADSSSPSVRWFADNYTYIDQRRYWGAIRYYDYLCYKDTANSWYAMLGMNLTPSTYHRKDSGKKSLSFTIEQSYSTETASNFSVGVGGEAGIGDMVKASASVGCGRTRTVGKSFQISSTVEAEIPATAKTGYYKMHVCHNFYKMKITRQRTDGTYPETQIIKMPYGEPYAAVLYSSTNASGSWAKW